jgi:NAD(P)-dependent dehydrogenase (short-subunit alcohol dehydrogenase family)
MRVVITGSSSGIGRALAERFLSQGHEVWGFARSDQGSLAEKYPGRFHAVRCDVASWSQVAAGAASVLGDSLSLDVLVTCAGLHGAIGPATRVDPEVWSSTIRTNLDGTYFAVRAFWAALSSAPRRGKVVCFSGGGATKARPGFSAYGAAKTAIVRLVETIAEEESGTRVDINAIAPGAIATRLTDEIAAAGADVVGEHELRAAQQTRAAGADPMQRALDCVAWLVSPASDGIRGKLISAPWDPWRRLPDLREELEGDLYTLRRIGPQDRGKTWGDA